MGPRIGRFDKNGMPCHMPGHSVPLSALGGLILVFGFFACNGTKQVQFKFSKKTTIFFTKSPTEFDVCLIKFKSTKRFCQIFEAFVENLNFIDNIDQNILTKFFFLFDVCQYLANIFVSNFF